jgi:predicted P-loop ATPase
MSADPNAKFRTAVTPHNAAAAWGLQRTEKGTLSTLANIVTVLQKDPLFAPERLYYDEFKDRVLITNSEQREIRSEDVTRIRHYLQESIGLTRATKADVKDAIDLVAWQRRRHCVQDMLASYVWDDEPRIDRWLIDYLGAVPSESQPLDYLLAAGRNTLLSLVARVAQPGCQVDTMLVLEGPQGIGKTTALRILGGDYYRVALESMTGKDFLQALRGAWLIEIAELSSTTKADVDRIKVIVGTPKDPYRPTYGAFTNTYPRQCIFVGTTNRDDYLMDETGGRRFFPVRVGQIQLAALAADREQLLAEAHVRMSGGEPWHLMPATTGPVQAHRHVLDAWTTTVTDYIQGKPDVTITEVLKDALKFQESMISDREAKRVGRILRSLGWERRSIRRAGRVTQGFAPQDDID